MEWREDVGPARAGDAAAQERLREYLTPFAHGVALAHAPHHLVDALVPRVLDALVANLAGVGDAQVGAHLLVLARKLARDAAGPRVEELSSKDAAVLEARQAISRLRALPELTRERFFLRVVEGVPGPELAEVTGASSGEVRADLERAAEAAARALSQPAMSPGDSYLWDLSGAPPPLLAQLEMQLPVLRFDPTAAAAAPEASSAGTFQELPQIGGGLGGHAIKPFTLEDETSVGTEVGTEPGVETVKPPQPVGPNPFEPQVRTIAATDLPVEAKGQVPMVPWNEGASSKSGKFPPMPARPVPQPGESERSGRSDSRKKVVGETSRSGRQQPLPSDSGKNLKQPPMPSKLEVTKDAPALDEDVAPTMAKVPALALQHQAEQSMLGRPTISLPISAAVETRVLPIPAAALAVEDEDTRVGGLVKPAPARGWFDGLSFRGSQPLFIAVGLGLIGLLTWSVSMFAVEKQARSSWQLAQVVVAAEDMSVGDIITVENVALRSVPEPFHGSGVVSAEAMNMVIDQRLAVAVQMGDPLFYSQLVSMRVMNDRLSNRVSKRGRAYTIETTAVSAVGRAVKPSDLVDVVVTFPMKERDVKVERRAVTLFQKVRVLATGKLTGTLPEETVDARDRDYTNITLLLTPEEAEALTLARQLGRVKLTLRNEEDLEEDRNLRDAYTDSDTLLDGKRRDVVQKKRKLIIDVIRGTPKTETPGIKQPK